MKHIKTTPNKEKRGLYIALALCLVAIVLAAWGTYDSLSGYIDKNANNADTIITNPTKQPNIQTPSPSPLPTKSPAPSPKPTPSLLPSPSPKPINENKAPANAVPYTIDENFVFPISSSKDIICEYGGDKLVYNETMKDYRTHNGIDIATKMGETVNSCNNGVVKEIKSDLLLGNIIIIEHGKYIISYCGMSDEIFVKLDDVVKIGDSLGIIGEIPSEKTSSHLHLEVVKDGKFVNPSDIIK